jgi:hypothetical protein
VVAVDTEVRPFIGGARQRASVRPWWRRGHTGFLALLLPLNIILDGFAFQRDGGAGAGLGMGIVLAQAFLMGFWMAFGGLKSFPRGMIVAAATAGGALAFSMSPGVLEKPASFTFPVLASLGGTVVLATYLLLLPLRLLLTWRVDFDEAYHANCSRGRMQLRLVDCINVVTSCALLFGCARCLDHDVLLVGAVVGGFALFSSLPIALVSVTPRPTVKIWLLGATTLGASLITEYVTLVYLLDVDPGLLFPFEFALMATLLLNLLPLRFIFGLHLFSVAKGGADGPAAELVENGLAEVEAAWPSLPETVRAQIVALARGAEL